MNSLVPVSAEFLIGAKHTLSADQVRQISAFISRADILTRWLLLDIHDNGGFRSVHCTTFDEYCAKFLKMDFSKAYYWQLVSAARVERLLFGPQTYEQLSHKEFPQTPVRDLIRLSALPEDKLKAAWDEYCAVHDSIAVNIGQATRSLKKIVRREEETAKAKEAATDSVVNNPQGPRDVTPKLQEQSQGRAQRSSPSVSSFTPPADPEPQTEAYDAFFNAPNDEEVKPLPIDWEDADWIMELASSWVKARGYKAQRQSLCQSAAMLRRIADWIEEGTR